jgi:hypothetical protein
VFWPEPFELEFYGHEPAQVALIEKQVDMEVLTIKREALLTG